MADACTMVSTSAGHLQHRPPWQPMAAALRMRMRLWLMWAYQGAWLQLSMHANC